MTIGKASLINPPYLKNSSNSLRSTRALSQRSGYTGSFTSFFQVPSQLPYSFTDPSFSAACRIWPMSLATRGPQLVTPDACRPNLGSVAKLHKVCSADGLQEAYSTDVLDMPCTTSFLHWAVIGLLSSFVHSLVDVRPYLYKSI